MSHSLPDAAPKRRGELSEAAFLAKAVSLGFKIVRPWGNSERYDFVLDSESRLWRIQIKATSSKRSGGYHIQPSHFVYGNRKVVYTSQEIDILAAHVVPLDVWYIIPVSSLAPGISLRLYPEGGCRSPRFEHYREAWNLLRESNHVPVSQPAAPYPEPPAAIEPHHPMHKALLHMSKEMMKVRERYVAAFRLANPPHEKPEEIEEIE